jgi:hypothetical protein
MKNVNRSLDAAKPAKPAADPMGGEPDGDEGDIKSNPEFMDAIDTLKKLGATEQDVEEAMGWGEEPDTGGPEATSAAGMGLAGLSKMGQ